MPGIGKVGGLPEIPTDGVLDEYLSNEHYAMLLCDARRDKPQLTVQFLTLNEWPEDFENYAGRIAVIRPQHKKGRKRQRGEQRKIMWKSPRGWKPLRNLTSDNIMVQYRARSDGAFRYRMFAFQSATRPGERDESLALLHVTHTDTPATGVRKPLDEEAAIAYEASAYYDHNLKSFVPSPPSVWPTPKIEMPSAPASPGWEPAIGYVPMAPAEGLGVIPMEEEREPVPLDFYATMLAASSVPLSPSDGPLEASPYPGDFDVSTFFAPTTPSFQEGLGPVDVSSGFLEEPFARMSYSSHVRAFEDDAEDEPPLKRQKTEHDPIPMFHESFYAHDPYLPTMACGDSFLNSWSSSAAMDVAVCA